MIVMVLALAFNFACTKRVVPTPVAFPENPEAAKLDISGTWVGYAGVYKRSADRNERWRGIFRFPLTLDLTQDGSDVSGVLELVSDDATQRTSYEIEGVVSGHDFHWRGKKFLMPGISIWAITGDGLHPGLGAPFECLQSGLLKPTRTPGGIILKGHFQPNPESPQGCQYGYGGIALERV